jgi:hypothetical protein
VVVVVVVSFGLTTRFPRKPERFGDVYPRAMPLCTQNLFTAETDRSRQLSMDVVMVLHILHRVSGVTGRVFGRKRW